MANSALERGLSEQSAIEEADAVVRHTSEREDQLPSSTGDPVAYPTSSRRKPRARGAAGDEKVQGHAGEFFDVSLELAGQPGFQDGDVCPAGCLARVRFGTRRADGQCLPR